MEKGLKDIRNKARELSEQSRLGIYEPYPISCGTLIAILDALEDAEKPKGVVRKVTVCKSFAERWTNKPEHYQQHYGTQNVEIKA